MRIEEYPNLMMVSKMVKPIDVSLRRLDDIRTHLSIDSDEIIYHGLFIMSVSSMEVMLTDVLKYFLRSFPQKLPNEFKYEKGVFFDNYFILLNKAAENYVNTLAYKSFEDFFKKLMEILSIALPDFKDAYGKYLKEIKATRNLLLHNNLIINNQYLDTAGDEKRGSRKGDKIIVNQSYVLKSIEIIIEFQKCLKMKIMEKYYKYTKVRANKELWRFMFKTSIMKYDDYWMYDEVKDEILALKKIEWDNRLSSSEMLIWGLWRSHFNGTADDKLKQFHMRCFDTKNQEKVLFFLSTATDFSFE